ncbi:MAG: amidase, partial [Verrucomicrobiota bacterium]
MKELLNLEDWQKLAANDPAIWKVKAREALQDCINKTNTSVVSSDLSEDLEITEGPLAGVPYGLKDLFDFAGVPTHNSSVFPELLDKSVEVDSDLVQKLKAMGASCAAKTQMNEFAYGLSGENPHYGDCPHPRLKDCLSGGSSSGSAHIVAAGYLPLAFGTDTGGSIRVPAAWCGIYGIRWVPGYSMKGAFPLAESFDTMGWFTRSAAEMVTVLKAWFDNES